MRIASTLQKLEIYVVAAVAVVVVSSIGLAISGPFSSQDYELAGRSANVGSTGNPSVLPDSQPAQLEPALRSLDGVAHHG